MQRLKILLAFLFIFINYFLVAQINKSEKMAWKKELSYRYVPSITEQIRNGTFIEADSVTTNQHVVKDKKLMGNLVVPGKGLPKGEDPLVRNQLNSNTQRTPLRTPELVFDATNTTSTPSDPTGAVGRDFYIAAWNVAFRIFDKTGTPVSPAASLGTLFGEVIGDPIVLYDSEADRYIVTQFSAAPNGFHVAVSETNNPVTGGWHIYSSSNFQTGTFPDYTKFSIWSDGYYVSANINGGTGQVFVIERDEMLNGNPSDIQAFNLPGIVTNGFYSPQIFNVSDDNLPAQGNATIVYLQDDSWANVDTDHLKLWTLNVDWANPSNSSISAATEIEVTPFNSVFDGGSFSNLEQPAGPDIDAVQGAIMNQAQFRKFNTHNSAVFNFVIDTGLDGQELAGVRWYELRQDIDGGTWSVFQEGTYCAPDGRHAFMASMAMDKNGNIGMGYSSLSNTESISLRYTGRFDGEPAGIMTAEEQLIVQSTGNSGSFRYSDYSHLTVDPSDNETFWFISEYFNPNRSDAVAAFKLADPLPNDVGVINITTPETGILTNSETVSVEVYNFGSLPQSNIPISYTINTADPAVNETIATTINPGEVLNYEFSTQADLSTPLEFYDINAQTNLVGDENNANDGAKTKTVFNGLNLCAVQATSGCNLDGIKQFILAELSVDDGGNGCNGINGYADRRNLGSATLDRVSGSNNHIMQVRQNWTGGANIEALSAWIDFNDNGDYEDSERLISSTFFASNNVLEDFTLTIPPDSNLGSHSLRVKVIDTSSTGNVNEPCTNFGFGEVHDYTVNIVDSNLNTVDVELSNGDFTIVSEDNNQYLITLENVDFNELLQFSVYNSQGKIIVFNNIIKENNKYSYNLDMSYAPKGVYLISLGLGKKIKTGKILVR